MQTNLWTTNADSQKTLTGTSNHTSAQNA